MTPTSGSAVLPIPAGPRTFGAGAPGATGRAAAADSTLLLSDKGKSLDASLRPTTRYRVGLR
jgi:hypothetical protein